MFVLLAASNFLATSLTKLLKELFQVLGFLDLEVANLLLIQSERNAAFEQLRHEVVLQHVVV